MVCTHVNEQCLVRVRYQSLTIDPIALTTSYKSAIPLLGGSLEVRLACHLLEFCGRIFDNDGTSLEIFRWIGTLDMGVLRIWLIDSARDYLQLSRNLTRRLYYI
jgi:hypothetical protein